MLSPEQLAELIAAPHHWTARAMQEQGSRLLARTAPRRYKSSGTAPPPGRFAFPSLYRRVTTLGRFFQALGMALNAADLLNRRLIYQTWPAECWDFYRRGQVLQAAGE